jgi:hypothetical protein
MAPTPHRLGIVLVVLNSNVESSYGTNEGTSEKQYNLPPRKTVGEAAPLLLSWGSLPLKLPHASRFSKSATQALFNTATRAT